MIRGRLGMAMLALGVIPMAIPSRPSFELDLRAAERAIDELTSAGINAHTVLEIAGVTVDGVTVCSAPALRGIKSALLYQAVRTPPQCLSGGVEP